MLKKVKISKLAIVLFLTILIWVWADRALDEPHTIYNATIILGRPKPTLWVYFDQGSSVDVNEINVVGPASRINGIEQAITKEPKRLEFAIDLGQFGIDKPGRFPVPVRDVIRESSWIKKEGLSIKSCDPCEVVVNAVALTQKDIDVQCFGEDELPRDLEVPQKVSMFVPSEFRGTARVDLSDEEVQRAIRQPVVKKPYIVLSNGQRRDADSTVAIKLSAQEDVLEKSSVANATLSYSFSENLLKDRLRIEFDNLPDILNFDIYATPAAKDAYENQWSQVELEIQDDDVETTKENEWILREVYYKLPEEYVRLNQIRLARPEVKAKFKVTLLPQAEVLP